MTLKIRQVKPLDLYTPSITVQQALDDLIASEKSKYLTIDMSSYFEMSRVRIKHDDNKPFGVQNVTMCSVCFAGAVMAQRFENQYHGINPLTFNSTRTAVEDGDKVADALKSLDYLRCYAYSSFIHRYYRDLGDDYDHTRETLIHALESAKIQSVTYGRSPAGFKRSMRKVIKVLKENGC